LDWLVEHGKEIRVRLIQAHRGDGNLVLYQIGPLTVPGADSAGLDAVINEGALGREFVIGLWCNFDGGPVAIELLDPAAAERGALLSRAEKLQVRLQLERVFLAGDKKAVAFPTPDKEAAITGDLAPAAVDRAIERMIPLRRRDVQKLHDTSVIPRGDWA